MSKLLCSVVCFAENETYLPNLKVHSTERGRNNILNFLGDVRTLVDEMEHDIFSPRT